jgi:hypothetical protein
MLNERPRLWIFLLVMKLFFFFNNCFMRIQSRHTKMEHNSCRSEFHQTVGKFNPQWFNNKIVHHDNSYKIWYIVVYACMCICSWIARSYIDPACLFSPFHLRTDDTNKKIDAWIFFWHIFIVDYTNNKLLKYQEFVNLLWCSKLYTTFLQFPIHVHVNFSLFICHSGEKI